MPPDHRDLRSPHAGEFPAADASRVAYQLPQPGGMIADLIIPGALNIDDDESHCGHDKRPTCTSGRSCSTSAMATTSTSSASGRPACSRRTSAQRSGARLRAARPLALPRARLGRVTRRLCLRAAWRNTHVGAVPVTTTRWTSASMCDCRVRWCCSCLATSSAGRRANQIPCSRIASSWTLEPQTDLVVQLRTDPKRQAGIGRVQLSVFFFGKTLPHREPRTA